jgi:hypothetical protein
MREEVWRRHVTGALTVRELFIAVLYDALNFIPALQQTKRLMIEATGDSMLRVLPTCYRPGMSPLRMRTENRICRKSE